MRVLRRVAVAATLVVASLVGGIRTESVSAERSAAQVGAPCPDPAGPVEPATIAEAEQLLIGTWIVCSGEIFPPSPPSEVGIEFDADGRFFRVYEDDDGNLIKVEGLEQEGEWEFIGDDASSPQLNLHLLGSGTRIHHLDFFDTPPLIQTISMIEGVSLVPWAGTPPEPGVPAGVGEGPCGLPRDPLELTSVGQVEGLLVGTWLACDNPSPFHPPEFGEVGITLMPDGRFYRVYEDPTGALISASGPGQEGTWVVLDNSAMSGPGSFQLDLNRLDVGTNIAHPVFLQQPSHLRLVTSFGPPTDYQPTTEVPVPGTPPNPAPTTPPDALPETGSNVLLALLALGLVGGGLVLVGMSRRRGTPNG